ncbi:MAG: bifunctional glutamate N-acetyltransferase/amino-acid acetyltransferase ArgJ, partial [Treponema sp.]|nr:bifunctional glutamate N-acetyltransferase/amino-acid acetyltransferase ArgJ [Treponema sp.]
FVENGVASPKGFSANGVLCGIKKGRTTPDLALIFSEKKCSAAATFTKNTVKAACISVTQEHISNGVLQAVIANSGNANACTGKQGVKDARKMAAAVASKMNIAQEDVAVCSTGVIGVNLPIEKIAGATDTLVKGLSKENHTLARSAIMTTDTKYKECAIQFLLGGKIVTIGAMCKGSGMIHINMGTMLSFITTDCAISSSMLKKALQKSVSATYNCVSVDGDTSTNDTAIILANGMAENQKITKAGADFEKFCLALDTLNTIMAKKIASDGEGATRLIECVVRGASDQESARVFAKSVISSNLVKAAMFGCDANWGRILCALGYSGKMFSKEKTTITFASKMLAGNLHTSEKDVNGGKLQGDGASELCFESEINLLETPKISDQDLQKITVFKNGSPIVFDEALAKKILSNQTVHIFVRMKDGKANGVAWGCDLTYDYVKINGDYRT